MRGSRLGPVLVGLALFVLLEKTIPAGHWFSRATGIVLLVWGAGTVAAAPAAAVCCGAVAI